MKQIRLYRMVVSSPCWNEATTRCKPPLAGPQATATTPQESVAARIERELAIVRASQLEVESVG